MLKSMTGFGRATYESENRSFTVEMKSVNNRYLDMNIRMPKTLMSLEENIRKLIKSKLRRGKIDIYISQNIKEKDGVNTILNKKLADSYYTCLNKIRDNYNVKDDISVSLIAKFPEVIEIQYEEQNVEKIWEELKNPVEEALDNLISMREVEGEKLQKDLETKCIIIKDLVKHAETRSPEVVKDYKERLENRIKELLEDVEVDESRIAMEIAIFADKSSIDEEIVRLYSHIEQIKNTFELNEPSGRKLDFIIQEMNREVNTIGSKSNDISITNLVLKLKNEIEKIREQIQNIE